MSNMNELTPKDYAIIAYEKLISETTIPVLRFELIDDKVGIFDNKVGGIPYLPNDMQIPFDKNKKQMKLLVQINCNEFKNLPNYPQKGMLQFYLTKDYPWEEYKIVYHKEIDENVKLDDIMKKIEDIKDEDKEDFPVLGQYSMVFKYDKESMSKDDDRVMALFCQYYNELTNEDISDPEDAEDETVYEIFEKYCDNSYGGGHKIGGYKSSSQPTYYDPFKYTYPININSDDSYVLLLQLESDVSGFDFKTRKYSDEKVRWRDLGLCNFQIKIKDLKNLNFDDVLYMWNCS